LPNSDCVTTSVIRSKKGRERISALTAYDVSFARLLDRAGVDIILTGDSLGQAVMGYDSTLPVTMEEMAILSAAVRRGVTRALVVADMPFLSYQASTGEAIRNAGRLLKESGVHAVKLEGGQPVVETVRSLTAAGIPVMGHLGMTPQSIHQFGGPKLQARTASAAERILEDARALEDAGAFAIVLEVIPWQVARQVTAAVTIPTIGIGAGPDCDGQILVLNDLLGLGDHLEARFCPPYTSLNATVTEAVKRWLGDVKEGAFPRLDQSYGMDGAELEKLRANHPHTD
jgi:3-methyl-2-oxobutanoate hydroxymethyltransferase